MDSLLILTVILAYLVVWRAVQFRIYKEIKERFKDYLWIDVVSKCDLLEGSPVIYAKEDRSGDEAEIIKYRETGPDESIHVSVKTEQGLNEVCNLSEIFMFPKLKRSKSVFFE